MAKALKPPEGGWTAEAFRRDGVALITTLTTTAKVVQRKAQPVIRRIARETFQRQLDAVVAFALKRSGERSAKQSIEISGLAQESLWAEALREVIDENRLDIAVDLVPPIQSVMAQGFAKTGAMLGLPPDAVPGSAFAARARSVATRITKISDTTRKDFEGVIRGAIDEGLTVSETAKRLKQRMPDIAARRQETIARTETMMAWTEGSVASMQQSGAVTEVDVIGCESREQERWGQPSFQRFMYRGEGTCNIRGVPIADADKLQFHPNHTGVVVPSKFRTEDGGNPDTGTGKPTDENEEAKRMTGAVEGLQKANGGKDWVPTKKAGIEFDEGAASAAFPEPPYVAKVERAVEDFRRVSAGVPIEKLGAAEVQLREVNATRERLDVGRLKKLAKLAGNPDTAETIPVLIRRKGKLWAADPEAIALRRLAGETKTRAVIIDAPDRGRKMGKLARGENGSFAPKETGPTADGYKQAFETLDKVIETPEGAPGFSIGAGRIGAPNGSYLRGANRIRLHTDKGRNSAQLAATAVHEAGHWMDDAFMGSGWKLERTLGHELDGGTLAKELMTAWKATNARKELRSLTTRAFFEYADAPIEVWARAFTQYVLEKAATPELTKVLQEYAKQGLAWTAADFAGLRAVVEAHLQKFNLLK